MWVANLSFFKPLITKHKVVFHDLSKKSFQYLFIVCMLGLNHKALKLLLNLKMTVPSLTDNDKTSAPVM